MPILTGGRIAFTFTNYDDRAMQSCAFDPQTGEAYVAQAQGYAPTEHTRINHQSATGNPRQRLGTMRLLYGGHGTTISFLRRDGAPGIITYWLPSPAHDVAGGLVWVRYRDGDVKWGDKDIVPVFPGYSYAHIDHHAGTVALRKGNLFRLFPFVDGLKGSQQIGVDVKIASKSGQPGQGYYTCGDVLYTPFGYGHLTDKSSIDRWSFKTGKRIDTGTGKVAPVTYIFQEPESGISLPDPDGTLVPYQGMSVRKLGGKKTPVLVRLSPDYVPPVVVVEPDPDIPAVQPPPDPPTGQRLHGNDVASYQPLWKPTEGDTFVFVKATEGTTYFNPFAPTQLKKARAAGLVVGHYHFLRKGSAVEQARRFTSKADIQPHEILVCDWEGDWAKKTHPTVEDAAAFIAEVKRIRPGHKVLLYCNRADWMTTKVKAPDGLWIAEYGVPKPATATDWIFWQYAKKPIDQSWSKFRTVQELRDWEAS